MQSQLVFLKLRVHTQQVILIISHRLVIVVDLILEGSVDREHFKFVVAEFADASRLLREGELSFGVHAGGAVHVSTEIAYVGY